MRPHERRTGGHHGLAGRPAMHHSRPWRRPERWVYVTASALWLTGAGWLICHDLLVRHGEFGDLPSPWEPMWMRAHGAAVMLFLIAFGALLPGHIAHGLRRRLNAATGIVMLSVVAALTATGYGLYYGGDGSSRAWISIAHWSIGLAAAAGLVAHAWIGRRRARRSHDRHARAIARAAARGRPQALQP